MTTPVCVSLTGLVGGATYQGALTPVDLGLALDGQTAHIQLSAKVPPGGVANQKTIALPQNLGNATDVQNFFLLKVDQPTQVELNGDASLTFNIMKQMGVLMFVGGPQVTQLVLTNLASSGSPTVNAHLTAVYGPNV